MTPKLNYPLKFYPIQKERIWGGNALHKKLNKKYSEFAIGESWEISAVTGSVSVVSNGFFKGKTINELIHLYSAQLLGNKVVERYGHNFPLLIKFIDAQSDLSIQLHPSDTLAKERHNSMGKEEMWYIMEAEPASRLMFGFNRVLDKKTYSKHLENNTLEQVLQYEKVNPGDVFHIPTGRVHAIGKGILLAEIQQSSDVTYRLYDYNRTDSKGNLRELHTELALDAIDFDVPKNFKAAYKTTPNKANKVLESSYFTTQFLHLTQKMTFQTGSKNETFTLYIGVTGKSTLKTDEIQVTLNKGDCILVPACVERYEIEPYGEVKLLQVFP